MKKNRNIISKVLQIIGGLTLIFGVIALANFLISRVFIEEASRITSPDEKVDVVSMCRNAGAATSQTEIVYVVPAGHVITKTDRILERYVPVFVADQINGKKVHWVNDRTLEIQYQSARISIFTNYTYPLSQDLKHVVNIRLSKME